MMFILLSTCYQLLALLSGARGAPVGSVASLLSSANGNRTILETEIAPPWTSSATYRGTSDILWSCLITLGACIYSAIHLNVPPHHLGRSKSLLRKLLWVGMALFAPELVLFTAYSQFQEARDLVKELNRLRFGDEDGKGKQIKALLGRWFARSKCVFCCGCGQQTTKESQGKLRKFDLTYGFYATMGGFVVDVRDMNELTPRVTLSPKALVILAELGYYVDYNPEVISDKSKANILGKGLVCIQVSWMVIQCIARKAAGYPLTLLELHTMVHVVCALVLYTLWLKKPLDVTDPTVVGPSAVDSSGANSDDKSFEIVDMAASAVEDQNNESRGNRETTQISELSTSPGDNPYFIGIIAFLLIQSRPSLTQRILQPGNYFTEAAFLRILKGRTPPPATALQDREIQPSTVEALSVERRYQIEPAKVRIPGAPGNPIKSGKEDNLRWKRAAAVIERCGKISHTTEGSRELQLGKASRSTKYDLRLSYVEQSPRGTPPAASDWNIELKGRSKKYNWVLMGSFMELTTQQSMFGFTKKSLLPELERLESSESPAYCSRGFFDAGLLRHASDFPHVGLSSYEDVEDIFIYLRDNHLLFMLSIFLPALYGGIHLSAWKFDFPTRAEAILWKTASLIIIGSGILIITISGCVWCVFSALSFDFLRLGYIDFISQPGLNRAHRVVQTVCKAVIAFLIFFYGLSRVYIVVEAFISLRHVPIGVYSAVPWTQSIPHI